MQGPHESKDMCMSEEHILDYTPMSGSLYQTANNDSGTVYSQKKIENQNNFITLHNLQLKALEGSVHFIGTALKINSQGMYTHKSYFTYTLPNFLPSKARVPAGLKEAMPRLQFAKISTLAKASPANRALNVGSCKPNFF